MLGGSISTKLPKPWRWRIVRRCRGKSDKVSRNGMPKAAGKLLGADRW